MSFQRNFNLHQESERDERFSKCIVSSNLVRQVKDPVEVAMGVVGGNFASGKKFTDK